MTSRFSFENYEIFIVAELSANHGRDIDVAIKTVKAAKAAGADAIKVQTYTPESMTIDSQKKFFRIEGTIWNGQNLYSLYSKAAMPLAWHKELKEVAESHGLIFFSTPFDIDTVDFLETLDVPLYKIASFEIVDVPLLKRIAQTGKPVIVSTGMATLQEIDEAVSTLINYGAGEIALLKCTSAYPAPPEEMNLRTIPHMIEAFNLPVGLSDHTKGIAVPVTAISLGASIIEKHFILSRDIASPDASFSLEPDEFKEMVQAVRTAQKALGKIFYGPTHSQKENVAFRRSLFAVEDIKSGEPFTEKNIRSIRPGFGLPPKYLSIILGRRARCDIERGTPLTWEMVGDLRR